jgi:hypothetical protein
MWQLLLVTTLWMWQAEESMFAACMLWYMLLATLVWQDRQPFVP